MALLIGILKSFIGSVLLIVLRLIILAAGLMFGFMNMVGLAWAVIGGLAAGWHGVLKGISIPLLWAFVAFLIDFVASSVARTGSWSGWDERARPESLPRSGVTFLSNEWPGNGGITGVGLTGIARKVGTKAKGL